jgi:hypothetical protein
MNNLSDHLCKNCLENLVDGEIEEGYCWNCYRLKQKELMNRKIAGNKAPLEGFPGELYGYPKKL